MVALKEKAIREYEGLLKELKKGKKPKYEYLMNLICFIDLPIKLDTHEFVKLQLLNHNDALYSNFGL